MCVQKMKGGKVGERSGARMEGIRATGMEGERLEEECRMELKEQIMKQTHQRVCRKREGTGVDQRHILRDR
jgi:hypothetical protein